MSLAVLKGVVLWNSWRPSRERRISLYINSGSDEEVLVENNKVEEFLRQNLGGEVEVAGTVENFKDKTSIERKKIMISHIINVY